MDSSSNRARSPFAPRRRGFTLVELLVVIVVIAILIALLLPAINGAVRTARVGAASAEINQLAQALAQFKAQYGVYPPSSIILSETGDYGTATISVAFPNVPTAVLQQKIARSVQYLRRIWPKMATTTTGATLSIPGVYYDFNNNGKADAPYMLDGAECLVFFLGGLPGLVDGNWTTVGFSKNPANPAISPTVTLGANRSSPMFEFRPGRLNDNYPQFSNGTSGNGFPEYSDNLSTLGTPQPFVYFSSYEGAGYDPDDVNYAEEGSLQNGTPVAATWGTDGQPSSGIGARFYNLISASNPNGVSFAPNPYTNGAPLPMTGNTSNPEYVNKNSFQIISAGIDGQFGIGGFYRATGADVLPLPTANPPSIPEFGFPANLARSIRQREQDNVTNFKGGRLD
jgi:prepilin-type N-terminal cleavage/methylation domain-containing protein